MPSSLFEYALQDKKQTSSENAWYAKAGYSFDTPWKPTVYYIDASRFSESWDNLFIGATVWQMVPR